ncbi:unnamed protein product, partial [marine sediment metagenome]
MNICVVGLGKLGSSMLAAIASKGHQVVGVDTNPQTLAAINGGRAPVDEPLLQGLLATHQAQIQATLDCEQAVRTSELVFVVVPTPSEPDGGYSTRHIIQAAKGIGEGIRLSEGRKLVALVSTVMPGQ